MIESMIMIETNVRKVKAPKLGLFLWRRSNLLVFRIVRSGNTNSQRVYDS